MRNRRLKDYTGTRFGRLVVTGFIERGPSPENNHLLEVVCDCGVKTAKRVKLMRSGHTLSCGCLQSEVTARRNASHGLSRQWPREYRTWKDMRGRCNSPTNSDYADYGKRGIKVCQRWNDFAAFLNDMGPRPQGSTIDRINVNGDYEPDNCRWADAKAQANNKRTNHVLAAFGREQNLQQWCDELGIEPSKVRYRLRAGYSPEEALKAGDLRTYGQSIAY